jgi:hypothetical protein
MTYIPSRMSVAFLIFYLCEFNGTGMCKTNGFGYNPEKSKLNLVQIIHGQNTVRCF